MAATGYPSILDYAGMTGDRVSTGDEQTAAAAHEHGQRG